MLQQSLLKRRDVLWDTYSAVRNGICDVLPVVRREDMKTVKWTGKKRKKSWQVRDRSLQTVYHLSDLVVMVIRIHRTRDLATDAVKL
jgi:hypothetical protein